MTAKKTAPGARPDAAHFERDLETFYAFATKMRARGAAKVMVCRGEGVDYVVEFESKEEKTDATDRHAAGFYMGEEECEDD